MVAKQSVILFVCSLLVSLSSFAGQTKKEQRSIASEEQKIRMVYPKKTELDLDATEIQGELRNAGDFYFQHKPEEKMDSLVKRRTNFHRQILRDVVFSK